MRDASASVLLTISILLVIAAVACGTDEVANQPSDLEIPALDPAIATLDQVLERVHMAMGAVSSYRTVSDLVTEGSEPDMAISARYITEWQTPGNLRTVTEESSPDGSTSRQETIRLLTEDYIREGDSVWKKHTYDLEHPMPAPRTENPLLDILRTEELELVSSSEFSDEGVPVFRLEVSVTEDPYTQGSGDSQEVYPYKIEARTTILIDRESFRFVKVSVETRTTQSSDIGSQPELAKPYFQTATVQPVDPTDSSGSLDVPLWYSWAFTTHSYEYNIPLTIVAPGEFELTSGITVETVAVSKVRTPRPEYTPTAIPTQNCSEQGASWPGCGIHSAADADVMLSVFPDDHKILIGDDVAITFAFDGPPHIIWTVDAYMWHLPDGSRVNICVPAPDVVTSNPPSDGIGRSLSHGGVYRSDEAQSRLQALLNDAGLVAEIHSRISYVEGRCD